MFQNSLYVDIWLTVVGQANMEPWKRGRTIAPTNARDRGSSSSTRLCPDLGPLPDEPERSRPAPGLLPSFQVEVEDYAFTGTLEMQQRTQRGETLKDYGEQDGDKAAVDDKKDDKKDDDKVPGENLVEMRARLLQQSAFEAAESQDHADELEEELFGADDEKDAESSVL